MKLLQYLVPGFLRKIDRYLLQNYPIVWETKIHYVLFYSTLLANAILYLIGNVGIPVSKNHIPDFELITFSIGWGLLFAFCAIGFYAYQQSFIRIKTYTLSQILLRYGLYLVAVISIFANVLVLPSVVRNRVIQVYSFEEIKKDVHDLARLGYLSGVLQGEISDNYYVGGNEKGKITLKNIQLQSLYQSLLNQHQEVEQMEKILSELVQIISPLHIQNLDEKRKKLEEIRTKLYKINSEHNTDFTLETIFSRENEILVWDKSLPAQYRNLIEKETDRIKAEINKQKWDSNFKQSVLNYFSSYHFYERILNLTIRDFNELRLLPIVTNTYQKIRSKYTQQQNFEYRASSEYALKEEPYNAEVDYHLNSAIHNWMKFHLSDAFLSIPHHLRYSNHISEAGQNIYKEYENKLSSLGSGKRLEHFVKPLHFQESMAQQWKSYTRQANALPLANLMLVVFSAALLLIVKLFTLRNLVISGVAMLVCLFSLVWFLFSEYAFMRLLRNEIIFPVLSLVSFDLLDWHSVRNSIYFLPTLIPILILIVMALTVAFVQWKQINRKWLQTFWVFVLSSALVASGITFMILFNTNDAQFMVFGSQIPDTTSYLSDNSFIQNMPYHYLLLWMGILLMYWFHNRMMRLPAKK